MASVEAKSDKEVYEQVRQVVSTYEMVATGICDYYRHPDGGWYVSPPVMASCIITQQHFQARDTDLLLVTMPKAGTTWIKALLYAAAARPSHDDDDDGVTLLLQQLASHNSHQLVPFLESQVYTGDEIPDLSSLPAPRLFATHIPAGSLPGSVLASGCKVVYLCRDPKDCFVSLWHFLGSLAPSPWDIHEALNQFCDGVAMFGPFWDHVLSYWRWHLETPAQVLFLTYEELSADTLGQLRRLAGFIGRPFTPEEQDARVDMAIVDACAIKSMVKQEVNRSGTTNMAENPFPNSAFFRQGVVGDWSNYLTPEMARRIDDITKAKFHGSGLQLPNQA